MVAGAGSATGGCSDSGNSATTGAKRFTFDTFFFAIFLAPVFFAAFFTAFLATPVFFAFVFAFAPAKDDERVTFFAIFFFAGFFFATVRLVFATGRFFALLFFLAMISLLLAVLRLLSVRVAPKNSAVICVMLESVAWIAYAARVTTTEPIRPLHDVWLRPRRVFRELASQPIGAADYALGAAQGMVGWLALSRAQNAGAVSGVGEIFGKALLIGGIAGIASLFLMGAIYSRLGSRTGKASARNQVIHVLAYGSVPVVASLVAWIFTALLAGEATFEQVPHGDVEAFIALLLHAQFLAYLLLQAWGVIIQVMGLSEIQGVTTRKALGLWILGQIIGFLALLFLMILIATLFPNAVST